MNIQHELIMPNEDLPFKMFLFEGREGNYIREKHWHRSIEIFAVFQGRIEFFLNDAEYPLECGDFVIVNSNEVHSIRAMEPNKTVVLQMPLKMFEKYYTGDQFICFAHAPQDQDEQVMEMICEMYGAYCNKHCGYDFKVQGLFYELLYLLVTRYREQNVHPDVLYQYKKLTRLSAITDYMKEHYKEELSLKSLAEIFGYSPSYLSRMFQKYAGINYKDYLQAIRTEYGCHQLLNTTMTIGEISLENGFPNQKAFSKSFYKRYGIMPGEFRKRQKSAIN